MADAGTGLQGLRRALGGVDPSAYELLLFGVAHPGYDQAEYDALRRLWEAGLVLVAPGGNGGGVEPQYPAGYPFVLNIGAAGSDGGPASFNTLQPNQKLMLPSEEGSSFAAAQLAGQAARLLGLGVPASQLEAKLLSRRRGHAMGPRLFEEDDKRAAQLGARAASTSPLRHQADHVLLLAAHAPAVPRMLRELKAAGATVEHLLIGAGAVLRAKDLERLRALPWVDELRTDAGGAAPTGREAARLFGLWKDLYFGGLAAKGLESDLEGGGALIGCMEAPAQPLAAPDEALRRQGRWAPSPPLGAAYNDTSVYLAGRVAVGVFLVESNGASDPNNCNWTAAQQAAVQAKITAGLAWVQAQDPSAKIELVYDWHFGAACDYEPVRHPGYAFNATWTQNAIAKLGYVSVRAYNDALRRSADADWSYSVFVANDVGYAPSGGYFTDGKFAFAYLGGPYVVMTYDNDNWGIGNMDSVIAHETGHIFQAMDEYSGACSAGTRYGYFNALNSNCISGGTLNDPLCPMRSGSIGAAGAHFCPATKLQLGWRDQDADGKTDVLDTVPAGVWQAPVPSGGLPGSSVALQGTLTDKALTPLGPFNAITLNAVTGYQWRLNGSAWNPGAFSDGAGDESVEGFGFSAGPLAAGGNLVELRAWNSAGNTQTAYLTLSLVAGTPTVTPTQSPTYTTSPTPSPGSPTTTPGGPADCFQAPAISASTLPTWRGQIVEHQGMTYFAYGDNASLYLSRWTGSAWSPVITPKFLGGTPGQVKAISSGGYLWVFATDDNCAACGGEYKIVSYRFTSGTLSEVGPVDTRAGDFDSWGLAEHQGAPWLAYTHGGLLIGRRFVAGAWQDAFVSGTNYGSYYANNAINSSAGSTGSYFFFMVRVAGTFDVEIWRWNGTTLASAIYLPGSSPYMQMATIPSYYATANLASDGSLNLTRRYDATGGTTSFIGTINTSASRSAFALSGGSQFVLAEKRSAGGTYMHRWAGTDWVDFGCADGLDLGGLTVAGNEAWTWWTNASAPMAWHFNACRLDGLCAATSFSPTPGPSATVTPTFTVTPGPYYSPTSTPTPDVYPGCSLMPDLSTAGITGTNNQFAKFFVYNGMPHLFAITDLGTVIARYNGGAWTQAPGSPVWPYGYSSGLEPVLDPSGNELWFWGRSSTCAGCTTNSLTTAHWDGSTVTETSLPWPGTLNAPRLFFHQDRPWIVDGQGSAGLLFLSYQGGAWVQEGLYTLPGNKPVALYDVDGAVFSTGAAVVVGLHDLYSSGYELWALDGGGIRLLDDFGGGFYSYSAGLALQGGFGYIVIHGNSPRSFRVRFSDLQVEEVSEGLSDRTSFAYLDAAAGPDAPYAAVGRQHPQGPWVDRLRFDGSRWEPLHCGLGLPAANIISMLVHNGRFYTAILGGSELAFYDCPASPPCASPSPTDTPTPGAYASPTWSFTRTGTRTATPWPSFTPTVSASPSPPGTLTATPTATPHPCGSVIRVCPSGACDFTTIAAAIAAACPGDRIEVEGADYAEGPLLVSKALDIAGVPGHSYDDPILRPQVRSSSAGPVFLLDLGAPRAVTLTNFSLRHALDGDLLSVSLSAGASLDLERLDLKGSAGKAITVNRGQGVLTVAHCAFWGYESPGGPAIRIDNAVSGGSGSVLYNSFLAAGPSTALRLSTGTPYSLSLSGNLVFNAGAMGSAALDLQGDALASGDFQAWWGYSSFHGGLSPGANDLGPVLPDFGALQDEDLRYSTLCGLAYAGGTGTALDYYGDTRPAAGQTRWSIGAAEPLTPSLTPTPTPTSVPVSPTLSPTFSPSPPPSSTRTLTPTFSATASPSLSPSATPSISPSPSVSATLTASPPASPTASVSPTADGSGLPGILRVAPYPNPNSRELRVELSGPVDRLELSLYSPAMVLLARAESGPYSQGWALLALPSQPVPQSGLSFVAVKAYRNGSQAGPRKMARLYRF